MTPEEKQIIENYLNTQIEKYMNDIQSIEKGLCPGNIPFKQSIVSSLFYIKYNLK